MNYQKALSIGLLFLATVSLTACPQRQVNKKQSISRGLRGGFNERFSADSTDPNNQCGSYSVANKIWGGVFYTNQQNQQAFQQEVYGLAYPSLSGLPEEDQLGEVSGDVNGSTGVRFWGNAKLPLQSGAISSSGAEIRVEIWDSKACQTRSDGSVRPMIPIHIIAGQEGRTFSGYRSGSAVHLEFADPYGKIVLDGQISGGDYQGTMSYSTDFTQGSLHTLGSFSVQQSGFFQN